MSELDDLADRLDAVVQQALDEAAEEAVKYAASLTKGELAASVQFRRNGSFGREIFSDKPYAEFVENGRPGFSAKNAKALRFEINGQVFFRKSVGPQAPKPFIGPAQHLFEQAAVSKVEAAIERLLS